MTEQLTISHEPVADIPILRAPLDRMQVAKLRANGFHTHGHWDGLRLGQVVTLWLAYREQYLVARGFGRLQSQPLSLAPL